MLSTHRTDICSSVVGSWLSYDGSVLIVRRTCAHSNSLTRVLVRIAAPATAQVLYRFLSDYFSPLDSECEHGPWHPLPPQHTCNMMLVWEESVNRKKKETSGHNCDLGQSLSILFFSRLFLGSCFGLWLTSAVDFKAKVEPLHLLACFLVFKEI